ncbi:uncharacterized protein EAE97_010035 [Botrytis byssoidea]|uniref:Alpha/beta hydrolase fold-3 domain-containing protein n=1 Tax=Botrytis byssoidea TaxID=139641 RepID=A0A9P5I740_9HELO|nr:uncharacterized protein EAE97_010035 [Botrytis byssoidea]KAF7927360.1 hypothetical protein EAE97_010035 [Botrytis byssoidea]
MGFENTKHLTAATKQMREKYWNDAIKTSISVQQAATTQNLPVKGPVWVSKFTTPSPSHNDNSRELLLGLIDETNTHNIHYDRPNCEPLSCEWTGYREGVEAGTPEPLLSENEKYQELVEGTKSPLTVLYLYGGSFVQSNWRQILMVKQRLSPQNPFPAAFLDTFQAYLSLLAPPPNSPHEAIAAKNIVIVGDSSGSALALSLLQVLLQLKRKNTVIKFHGNTIQPAEFIPAGLALLSVTTDLVNTLPSHKRNIMHDVFPIPIEKLPYLEKSFPTSSPVASFDWSGSCPLWFASGQEQIVDGSRLVAQTAFSQGVPVVLQKYEGMPHTFFWVFSKAPQTRKILADWAEVIVAFAEGKKLVSKAEFIHAKGLKTEELNLKNLVSFGVAQASELLWKKTLDYKVPLFHQHCQSSL